MDNRTRKLLLFLILAIAASVRLWGNHYGLPYFEHPDEAHYLPIAMSMLEHGDPRPHYFQNPPLLTYMFSAAAAVMLGIGRLCAGVLQLPEPARAWSVDPTSFYILARSMCALLGAGTVYLLFRSARRLAGNLTAFLSAFLLAVCFLHVRDSHFAVNDIAAAFFLMLSFGLSLRVWKEKGILPAALAGAAAGLAIATKYTAGLVILPFFAACFFNRAEVSRRITVYLCCLALAFSLACPWYLEPREFIYGIKSLAWISSSPWPGALPFCPLLQYLFALGWGLGLVPLVFAAAGLAFLFRDQARFWIAASFPLAYFLLMGASKLFFVRFAIPLLPFACFFAAVAAAQLISRCAQGSTARRAWYAVLFALILSAQSIAAVISHNRAICRTDSRVVAGKWMQESLSPAERILIEAFAPDISKVDYRLGKKYARGAPGYAVADAWSWLPKNTMARYREQSYTYIVTSDFMRRSYTDYSRRYPGESLFYSQLEHQAQKVYDSDPYGTRSPWLCVDDTYSPFYNVFFVSDPGPRIRVFRIR